jgi:hypothetical protein
MNETTKNDLLSKLKNSDEVHVVFTKRSGETRKMVCTLKENALPSTVGSGRSVPDGLICVYDLQNKGWRSFYLDSVQSYNSVVYQETK